MNHLAHAYLSFQHPQILVGNIISDFVKGNKQFDYPARVQKGIRLHRAIDSFTDSHCAIKEMKAHFKSSYGLYSGVFVDIVCDFFLANDKNEFSSAAFLKSFSTQVYFDVDHYSDLLPLNFKQYFFYMKTHDWLYNFQFEDMIQKSFEGIGRRAKFMGETNTAFEIFKNDMRPLEAHYKDFFPALKEYSLGLYNRLLNDDYL